MILADTQILEEIESKHLVIDPFETKYLEGATYDLRPGRKAATITAADDGGNGIVDFEKAGVLVLEPYSPAVVTAREHLIFPLHLAGRFGLKSGLSRRGIYASVGPQVDPGFDGWLSVTLFNFTPTPVALDYRESFLSLEFNRLSGPASRPYKGEYQGQEGFTAKEIEPVLGYKGHGLGEAVAGFTELRQSIGKVAALSDKFDSFLSSYEQQNREVAKQYAEHNHELLERYERQHLELIRFSEGIQKENQRLMLEMKKLVEHIVSNPDRTSTVILRALPRDEARREVLELFQSSTGPLFYSDIAERLQMDLEQVLDVTTELEREGLIGEQENPNGPVKQ